MCSFYSSLQPILNLQFGHWSLHLHFGTKFSAKKLFIDFDDMFCELVHQKVKTLISASHDNYKKSALYLNPSSWCNVGLQDLHIYPVSGTVVKNFLWSWRTMMCFQRNLNLCGVIKWHGATGLSQQLCTWASERGRIREQVSGWAVVVVWTDGWGNGVAGIQQGSFRNAGALIVLQ